MPLFTKQEHELETHFDKWLYFLKNLETFDHIPAILNEPIFQKAFRTAELANLPQDQYTAYEQNLIGYWGVKASLETAREEGRAEGEWRKVRRIARTLKQGGLPKERIAEAAELMEEEIRTL